ncbi:calcium-binding protein, partial [Microvirga subterranea]
VWLDGQQVVNYSGAVGYTDQSTTHWNMGIYRSSPAGGETIAYNVKGLDLSYGSSATAANHGTPTFSGTTQAGPTATSTPNGTTAGTDPGKVLKGGSAGDSLAGTAGNDKIYGYAGKDTILGNDGDDNLSGGNGNDHLKGEKGNDYLNGGIGNDYLYGGAGADIFSFNARPGPTNVDHIAGFNPQQDSIYLDNGVFNKLGGGSRSAPGALSKDFFTIGEKAKDANDHVIYDKAKGILYYDADGSGHGEAVAFATIGKNLKMTHADFFVI